MEIVEVVFGWRRRQTVKAEEAIESYLDALWIDSGVAERYAYRQLSDVRSPLSHEGRELAKQLEAKVRVPVDYYLMKHDGVSDKRDRQRRCPSCRGRWLLPESLHGILDFRCERCRLVSNVAFDVRISRT